MAPDEMAQRIERVLERYGRDCIKSRAKTMTSKIGINRFPV